MAMIDLMTGKPVEIPPIVVGTWIRYDGDMANAGGDGVIAEEVPSNYPSGKPNYRVILDDGRNWMTDGLSFAGKYARMAVVDAPIASMEEISDYLMKAATYNANESAKKAAAASAFAAKVESLKAEWPKLEIGGGCVVAAKNLRKILKKTWPKVKFSVTTSSYSGGNSMSVRWIDGPTTKMVEDWADRFSAGSFDGMTDYYNYESSPWTELFGSAKYVSCARSYSDAAIASAIAKTVAEYGPGENVTVEAYRNGDLNRVTPVIGARAYGPYCWSELINVAMYNEAL